MSHVGNSIIGGHLKYHYEFWLSLTNDPYVLDCIRGAHILFIGPVPPQQNIRREYHMSEEQKLFVDRELEKLEQNGSVKKLTKPFRNGWFSPIFLILKRSKHEFRLILDLSTLNKFVKYTKFRLDHVEMALNLVTRNCFLGGVDIRQCFNHMAISRDHWRYLMFSWHGAPWCFVCTPNGLSNAPYKITRVTKVLLAFLRCHLVELICYIDDIFVRAASYSDAKAKINFTVATLEKAGFVINYDKSVLEPTQKLVFLGFLIDTVTFQISLTQEKRMDIWKLCDSVLKNPHKKISIHFLAKLIGKIIATFPASNHAQLHYCALDRLKVKALKIHKDNWSSKLVLSHSALTQIQWWFDNVFTSKLSKSLHSTPPTCKIFCDACNTGWGSVVNCVEKKGAFSAKQLHLSVNTKELLAVYYGIVAHLPQLKSKSILVLSDNTTCVSTIRKKSSANLIRDRIVGKLFDICFANNITVFISHISGKLNFAADRASRTACGEGNNNKILKAESSRNGNSKLLKNCFTEWSLHPDTVKFIKTIPEFNCDFDLFASEHNHILPCFAARFKCEGAEIIDCFTMNWSHVNGFLFCPPRLVSQCIAKIERENARVQGVFPVWPSASFWPTLVQHMYTMPTLLPKDTAKKLFLPWDQSRRHPLSQKM